MISLALRYRTGLPGQHATEKRCRSSETYSRRSDARFAGASSTSNSRISPFRTRLSSAAGCSGGRTVGHRQCRSPCRPGGTHGLLRAARPGVLALGDLGRGEPDEIARLAARRGGESERSSPGRRSGRHGRQDRSSTRSLPSSTAALAAGWLADPDRVAHTLRRLQEHGIDRVTMVELVPDTYQRLAPFLHSH